MREQMSHAVSLFFSFPAALLLSFLPGHLLLCAFHRDPPKDLSFVESLLFRVVTSIAIVAIVAYLLSIAGHFSLLSLLIVVLIVVSVLKTALRIPLSLASLPSPRRDTESFFIIFLLAASILLLSLFPLSEWVTGEGEIGRAYNGGLMVSRTGSLFYTDEWIREKDSVQRAPFIGADFLEPRAETLFYGFNVVDMDAGRILPYHANMNCIFFAITDVFVGRVPPSWTLQFFHLLTLIAIFFIGKRLFGRGVGILSALLLSVNYIQFYVIREEGIDLIGQTFAWTGILALTRFYERRSILDGIIALLGIGMTLTVKLDFNLVVFIIVLYLIVSRPAAHFDGAHRFFANGLLVVGGLFVTYLYTMTLGYWRAIFQNLMLIDFIPGLRNDPNTFFVFFVAAGSLALLYFNSERIVSLARAARQTGPGRTLSRIWRRHHTTAYRGTVMLFAAIILLGYCKGRFAPPFLPSPDRLSDARFLNVWEEFGLQMYRVSWIFGGPFIFVGTVGFCEAVLGRHRKTMVLFLGWVYVESYLFYLIFGIRSPFSNLPYFYRYDLLVVVPVTILFISHAIFRIAALSLEILIPRSGGRNRGNVIKGGRYSFDHAIIRRGVPAILGAALIAYSLWIDRPFFQTVHHGDMRSQLNTIDEFVGDDVALFGTEGFGWTAKQIGVPLKFVYGRTAYGIHDVSDMSSIVRAIEEWLQNGKRVYLIDIEQKTMKALQSRFLVVFRKKISKSFWQLEYADYHLPQKNTRGCLCFSIYEAIPLRDSIPVRDNIQGKTKNSVERPDSSIHPI